MHLALKRIQKASWLNLLIALSAFSYAPQAQAQIPKNISEYAGQRCNTPPAGSGVIVGQFNGVASSPFISDGDGLVPIDRFRCFTSLSECKGWIYTMQSKYSNAGLPRIARCTKR